MKLSDSPASPTLTERPDGLYDFHGNTIQDHIAVWRTVDSGTRFFALGNGCRRCIP